LGLQKGRQEVSHSQKIVILVLLPVAAAYFGWLVATAISSGQAYFPRLGYYSRQLQPASFWGLVTLTLLLAIAFLAGWFMLVMEYLANWR
jgi:hypothetical protein